MRTDAGGQIVRKMRSTGAILPTMAIPKTKYWECRGRRVRCEIHPHQEGKTAGHLGVTGEKPPASVLPGCPGSLAPGATMRALGKSHCSRFGDEREQTDEVLIFQVLCSHEEDREKK